MKYIINKIIVAILIVTSGLLVGCYKQQTDYNRDPKTIDPHIYKTTWQYLNDRANGTVPADTIFRLMLQGIQYAEIDSNIYKQTGKTFILLNNDAIRRMSGSTVQPDCFFGANLVNNKTVTKWTDYPKDFVKNYLLYLVLDGVFDHYTLPAIENVSAGSSAPAGSLTSLPTGVTRNTAYPFIANANSGMKVKVVNSSPSNTSDYPIALNDVLNVRTSSILATNGSIHVIDRFLTTTVPE